jgi:hypothetical protein
MFENISKIVRSVGEMVQLVSPPAAPPRPTDGFLVHRVIDAENQITVGVAAPGGYEGFRIGHGGTIHRITETDYSTPDKIRYAAKESGIEMEFYSCSKSPTGICYNLWVPMNDFIDGGDPILVRYKPIALGDASANLDRIERLGFSANCRRLLFKIEEYLRVETSEAAMRGFKAQYAHMYEECYQRRA